MQQSKPHADIFGRVIGMLILLAGIAALAFVFNTANTLFHKPIVGLEFLYTKSSATPAPANMGAAVLEFVKQLVFLGLMTVVASIMAGKGIALYLGAIHWGQHAHAPTHVEAVHQPDPAVPATAPKPQNG